MASSADAGGFASARFGGEHGNPTTDNATAIYYNPAGLALGSGTRIFVEGLIAYRNASYKRPEGAIDHLADGVAGTPTADASTNAGTGKLSNIITSPFVGVVTDFGVKNLGVGFAVFAPFGGQASWDKNDQYKDSVEYPGAVDGVQRWATMDGTIKEVYGSLGVAYRLPGPRISFGITASVISESVNTVRARVGNGTDDLVDSGGGIQEGRSHIDVSGITFGAGAGIMWEAIDDLHIGVSYQSQPGFGETTQNGDLNQKLGAAAAGTSELDFLQELPDVTRFGVRYKAKPNLELRFSADFTRWSVLEKQCLVDANDPNANCALDSNGGIVPGVSSGVIVSIPRYWEDTYGARVGASYWLSDSTELAGGLSYDSSAVPDKSIDPTFIDMDKMIATFGGRFRLNENLQLNASYTHVYYFTRKVDVRERDAMGEGIGFTGVSKVPDHGGTYKQMIGLLNLGVEYQF
jgi:long-chain fatty acid transport protein